MTTRAPSDLLLEIRLRRDALYLAGRDPQGVAPTPPEQSSTWVVTQVEPVLMAMPVGGAAVSVEATDAVKGVRVGHRIRVEVRGAGSRVAAALLDQLEIKERDGGDEVAKVNGKPLTVGGSTTITADDVGALPGDTTLADLGYTGVPSHTHTVGSAACTSQTPTARTVTRPASAASYATWQDWAEAARTSWQTIQGAIGDLSSKSISCSGCGASGATSSSGGGGGTPTPTNPGSRSIVVPVSDPAYYEPGSPDAWSWTWGADIWTLVKRAAWTLSALSGKTISVTGGSGSITTRSYGSINTSEPVPWEQYSQVWGDQIGGMIAECYYSYGTIVGSYTISGGSGSVTLGPATPTNPAQSPPVSYSQPYGASVRLAVKRLHEALQALCGGSFPVS